MLDPSENGLFDIPDYEHTEDERFPPLPPPSSPGQGNIEGDPFGNGEGLFFILNHLKNVDLKGLMVLICFKCTFCPIDAIAM